MLFKGQLYKKITTKKHKHVDANNNLLNKQWATEGIKEEI